MKVFFDLFPVILFFIGFKLYDIFTATAIAIGATIALIIYSKIRHGKVEKMLMINGIIISILGGITLLLHDKTFIMWKPTVLYWLLAGALLISNIFFKKNLIQQMMGKMLNPPTSTWSKLNLVWVIFLIALGFLNLYIAFNYSEDTWVNFKLFGVTSMMFVFMIGQTLLLKDYLVEQPTDKNQTDQNQEGKKKD
ncbi:MAG: septation protein A [Methylophilaceae bacterium]